MHLLRHTLYWSVFIFAAVALQAQPRIGIGTTQPTATLDVNGTLRFDMHGAGPNRVLTAIDNQGNARWQALTTSAPLVAFAVTGSASGGASNFPGDSKWYRVPFGTPHYNFGSHYTGWTNQPGYNIFTVPVSGIYSFDTQVRWYNNGSSFQSVMLRLVCETSSGHKKELTSIFNGSVPGGNPYLCQSLRGHFGLVGGDKVWVEVAHGSSGARSIENTHLTYFNGHLALAF